VFRGVAQRGKSSLGWFYGFKLHIVTNGRGELLAVRLTPGNVNDQLKNISQIEHIRHRSLLNCLVNVLA